MLLDKLPAKPPTLELPLIAPAFTTPFKVTFDPVPIIPPTLFSPVTFMVFFTFSITALVALPTTAPVLLTSAFSDSLVILPEIRLKLRIVTFLSVLPSTTPNNPVLLFSSSI